MWIKYTIKSVDGETYVIEIQGATEQECRAGLDLYAQWNSIPVFEIISWTKRVE